jgi:hypothetical protein
LVAISKEINDLHIQFYLNKGGLLKIDHSTSTATQDNVLGGGIIPSAISEIDSDFDGVKEMLLPHTAAKTLLVELSSGGKVELQEMDPPGISLFNFPDTGLEAADINEILLARAETGVTQIKARKIRPRGIEPRMQSLSTNEGATTPGRQIRKLQITTEETDGAIDIEEEVEAKASVVKGEIELEAAEAAAETIIEEAMAALQEFDITETEEKVKAAEEVVAGTEKTQVVAEIAAEQKAEINLETIEEVELEEHTKTLENSRFIKLEVTTEDIAEVISKWAGIPVNKMLEGVIDSKEKVEAAEAAAETIIEEAMAALQEFDITETEEKVKAAEEVVAGTEKTQVVAEIAAEQKAETNLETIEEVELEAATEATEGVIDSKEKVEAAATTEEDIAVAEEAETVSENSDTKPAEESIDETETKSTKTDKTSITGKTSEAEPELTEKISPGQEASTLSRRVRKLQIQAISGGEGPGDEEVSLESITADTTLTNDIEETGYNPANLSRVRQLQLAAAETEGFEPRKVRKITLASVKKEEALVSPEDILPEGKTFSDTVYVGDEVLTAVLNENLQQLREFSPDYLPDGAKFDPVKRVIDWTPKEGQLGIRKMSYTVSFAVQDKVEVEEIRGQSVTARSREAEETVELYFFVAKRKDESGGLKQ